MKDVSLPDERAAVDEPAEDTSGQPRDEQPRVLTQDEVDEADSTGRFAVVAPDESDEGGTPETDSPARI